MNASVICFRQIYISILNNSLIHKCQYWCTLDSFFTRQCCGDMLNSPRKVFGRFFGTINNNAYFNESINSSWLGTNWTTIVHVESSKIESHRERRIHNHPCIDRVPVTVVYNETIRLLFNRWVRLRILLLDRQTVA